MADYVLEVKNLHTYFFADTGTVPAVDENDIPEMNPDLSDGDEA